MAGFLVRLEGRDVNDRNVKAIVKSVNDQTGCAIQINKTIRGDSAYLEIQNCTKTLAELKRIFNIACSGLHLKAGVATMG
jgi:hypothetical protein